MSESSEAKNEQATTREAVAKAICAVLSHHERAPQNGSMADQYTLLADVAQRVLDLGLDQAMSGMRALPARCAECGHTKGATWGSCRQCEGWRWDRMMESRQPPSTGWSTPSGKP